MSKLTILSHYVAPKNTNVRINSPVRFYMEICKQPYKGLMNNKHILLGFHSF